MRANFKDHVDKIVCMGDAFFGLLFYLYLCLPQPREVVIDCQMVNPASSTFSSSSGSKMGYVDVSWEAPRRPNGQIEFYNIKLKGVSTFRNADGVTETDTIVPGLVTYSILFC